MSREISFKAWILLIFLGFLWGGSFFFSRIAVPHLPPFTLALLRFALAAFALHIYIAGRYGFYEQLLARAPQFLLLGLVNNAIPHSLIFFGQTQIGAGLASILNATTPIWTVLIAHTMTDDEKLTSRKIAGTIVGFCGTGVLFFPHIRDTGGIPFWALLLPIGAAISYSLASIYSRRFRGVAPPVIAAGQLTASTLLVLPVALVFDHPWTLAQPPAGVWLAVLGLALASTALAYILYFRIIALAGATNASLVTLLVPPSAILLGVAFLGETIDAWELAGMVFIAAALAILDGRVISHLRKKR